MVRASVLHTEGRGFEPLTDHMAGLENFGNGKFANQIYMLELRAESGDEIAKKALEAHRIIDIQIPKAHQKKDK